MLHVLTISLETDTLPCPQWHLHLWYQVASMQQLTRWKAHINGNSPIPRWWLDEDISVERKKQWPGSLWSTALAPNLTIFRCVINEILFYNTGITPTHRVVVRNKENNEQLMWHVNYKLLPTNTCSHHHHLCICWQNFR